MVKIILLLLLFGAHLCPAQDISGKLQLSVTGGYRQENLRWSIAGNADGQNPNILSALQWKNLGGPVTGIRLQFVLFDHWQLEGEYERMFISSGKVSDTDYGGNDRTNIVYTAQFKAGKGNTDHWQAGLGYEIPVTNKFSITPSAGYGKFHQSLYLYGYTVAFNDLNSTYKTKWTGPYGQVLCSAGLTKKLGINAGLRYNQVQYRASANWNLINMFNHPESFRHMAKGYGIRVQASLLYMASGKHSIGIKGSYSHWQTGRGIDELYLSTGRSEQTQLNEVRSSSWQVLLEWRTSLMQKN